MKYKDLKGKAKVEFIWDYYKLPILGTLVAFIMIVWIGTTVWENKHKVIALDLTIVGAYVDANATLLLQESLQKAFVEKGIEGEVVVDAIDLSTTNSPDVQMANNTRLFAKTSANEIDVLITFADTYQEYAENGMFAPLDAYFANGILAAEEDAKIVNTPDEATQENIYGVNVTLNPKLTGITDPTNKLVVSIYVNSEKKENAIEALKFILE